MNELFVMYGHKPPKKLPVIPMTVKEYVGYCDQIDDLNLGLKSMHIKVLLCCLYIKEHMEYEGGEFDREFIQSEIDKLKKEKIK